MFITFRNIFFFFLYLFWITHQDTITHNKNYYDLCIIFFKNKANRLFLSTTNHHLSLQICSEPLVSKEQ